MPPLALPGPEPTCQRSMQLTQYEAVRLFIERAQAVKPDFALTNENAPAVAEICRPPRRPAAGHRAGRGAGQAAAPQAMLPRLEQPPAAATGGARDLPARQQTLRGAIAWSYDLLRRARAGCSSRAPAVFAGGFDLEAAEAVCDAIGDGASLRRARRAGRRWSTRAWCGRRSATASRVPDARDDPRVRHRAARGARRVRRAAPPSRGLVHRTSSNARRPS